MERKEYLLIISLFVALFIIILSVQAVSAIIAESDDYSVGRFGTGLEASNLSSDDLEARFLLVTGAATRNAENEQLTANIGFWGNTSYYVSVSITSYSIYPESAAPGSIVRLSISALNAQSVWAVITLPSAAQETLALNNNGNAYYTADLVGVYSVTFYANNSWGNLASVIDTFEIVSPSAPSGGGGGVTTIIEKCVYIWDCTSWSICSEGKQNRACENLGNCTGTEGKPIEERVCSDALFDVTINLENVKLTMNDTLNFNVSLIETKGIEKIDVQIRYSIIDSNNNEIFSQIETRAILGNLTFEKEIKEMKLNEEKYILRVDILYGNQQRAFAEQKFEIKGKEIEIESPLLRAIQKIKTGFWIIVLIVFLLVIRLMIKRRKKNLIEQNLREGLVYISKGKTREARSAYEIIKRVYNPADDPGQKIYSRIMSFYNKILKSGHLMVYIGIMASIALFSYIFAPNVIGVGITGRVISSIPSHYPKIILMVLMVFVLVLMVLFRKGIAEKYSRNSAKGMINKKVYSERGYHIGRAKDVILGKNKIEKLKIKIDKRHKFKKKGIVINYKHVKNVGHIVFVDEGVFEHLENLIEGNTK